VVALQVKNALQLAAMNDAAARLGLRAGMALADAKAMYPALAVVDADPEADERLLVAVADWCDRYTPLVGLDPPDGLTLDITGCAHLFGGEAVFCDDIVRRLTLQGLAARAAIADTVGCAWAVARFGDFSPPPCGEGSGVGVARRGTSLPHGTPPHPNPPPREVGSTRLRHQTGSKSDKSDFDWGRESAPPSLPQAIVPPGDARAALLGLRLAALRIAPDIEAALRQAGLKCIADVIDRPRAPLAARFGAEFIRRIDQAVGRDEEPITPRLPVPPYVAERRFAEPILLEADVLRTTELLGQELARMLERRGEGARRLQVALFRTDGKVHRIEVGTGAPLRDPVRMRALFAERLAAAGDVCDPGFGFDVVRLAALATERCDPVQTGLAEPDHSAELAHLIDRLGARFGLRRITRPVPHDSHIPEFAVAPVAAHSMRGMVGASNRTEHQHSLIPAPARIQADSLCPPRPIRLFGRPEPIEAIAEVPDGPPVRFRWRRVLHQVAHAEGPERIAMEWWRDHQGRALTRDYFRVESREGVRVWVYREGLYGRELMEPRWFLHGLFA
jgi:protein ImuB